MKIGTYYRIPIPLYWALKSQALKWEEHISVVITQAINQFTLTHQLKSIDELREDPKSLETLLRKGKLNTKRTFKGEKTVGFSLPPEVGLQIHLISLQLSISKVETLIQIISEFLTSLNVPLEGERLEKEYSLMELIFKKHSIPKTFETLDAEGYIEEGKSYSQLELNEISKQLRKIQNLTMKGGDDNDQEGL